jgi:23S rRNA (cytidine1920-2'-O)/16S rRNA (cytidine1409-2'-O)-methyltransferase
VGYGQLAWKLKCDTRVVSLERSNIRYLTKETLKDDLDGAVIDVSFISLRKVIPTVVALLKSDGEIIALIKPQFEVGRGEVGKGGVVRDAGMHEKVIESPLVGPQGNREFLMYLKK